MTTPPDAVARIVAQWATERPDLDASPMLVIGRLHRLAQILDDELRPVFADAGLGPGEFDVLAALRRAGAPFERTPTDLAASTMVTSGAVTKRVDRLLERGLVRRSIASDDARSRRIALTDKGLQIVDECVARHVDNERWLLRTLPAADQDTLARILGTWLTALEG